MSNSSRDIAFNLCYHGRRERIKSEFKFHARKWAKRTLVKLGRMQAPKIIAEAVAEMYESFRLDCLAAYDYYPDFYPKHGYEYDQDTYGDDLVYDLDFGDDPDPYPDPYLDATAEEVFGPKPDFWDALSMERDTYGIRNLKAFAVSNEDEGILI